MKTVFSTRDVHPRDKFESWRAAICDTVVEHHSTPEMPRAFSGELEVGAIGSVDLWRLKNSVVSYVHQDRHIAQTAPNHLFVFLQTQGTLGVEQNGREAVLESGQFALVDPIVPYSGHLSSNSDLLVLGIPRAEIEARLGKTIDLVSRPIQANGSLASSYLTALSLHEGQLNSEAEDMAQIQCLDLIALDLSRLSGRPCQPSHALTVFRIRSVIESHMRHPGVGVADIAAAAGVSVRYGNSILAEQGTSLSRLLKEMRLERCRKALSDPAQSKRSVSDIAFSWGFSDLTHFGRAFRAAYGMLPSECRQLALKSN